MIPILFHIGPIPVYSFGLMMGLAFIVASYLLTKEAYRRGLDPNMMSTITLIALIAGVAGSKLFSLFENWDAFVAAPFKEIFSPSGLTFYGGLILATASIYYYTRKKKVRFMQVADAAAPVLILAYGIGRIGCQLAGDGDYGIPTMGFPGMGYPDGTVSTLAEKNPQLVEVFKSMYPGEAVPETILVHPTPVYETLAAFAIFALLWYLRKKKMPVGKLFAIYLVFAGLERFLVEFVRLNPHYEWFSQAQWISLGMMALGGFMITWLRNAPIEEFPPYQPPAARPDQRKKKRARRNQ